MTAMLARRLVPVGDGQLAVWTNQRLGPALVFLHGGGVDRRMWEQQVAVFAETNRVVLLDARGHGESSAATDAYRHCDDVAAVFSALDLGPAVLVGLSMGGATAVDVALERPDLVAGLVVSGVGTSEPEFTDPWVLDVFAEWKAAEETRDVQRWLDGFLRFASGPYRSLEDVDADVVDRLRRMAWDTLQHHAVHGFVPPTPVTRTWERASAITVPVVAVSGTLDSPDHIRMPHRLAAAVPGGRVIDIPGTAHYPNMEQPAAFNRVVADAAG